MTRQPLAQDACLLTRRMIRQRLTMRNRPMPRIIHTLTALIRIRTAQPLSLRAMRAILAMWRITRPRIIQAQGTSTIWITVRCAW